MPGLSLETSWRELRGKSWLGSTCRPCEDIKDLAGGREGKAKNAFLAKGCISCEALWKGAHRGWFSSFFCGCVAHYLMKTFIEGVLRKDAGKNVEATAGRRCRLTCLSPSHRIANLLPSYPEWYRRTWHQLTCPYYPRGPERGKGPACLSPFSIFLRPPWRIKLYGHEVGRGGS